MGETVPSQADIIGRAFEARLRDLYTIGVGRIDAYDRTKQRADVTPMVQSFVPDTTGGIAFEDLPQIPNVPCLFLRSGPVAIIFDLIVGSHVTLLINTHAINGWLRTGQLSSPVDLRIHHLGNAMVLPVGPEPNSNPIACAAEGKLVIDAEEIWLGANATALIARADRVEQQLQDIQDALTSHTHTYTPGSNPPAQTGPSDSTYGAGSVGCDKIRGV